jgi:hypothetical protein
MLGGKNDALETCFPRNARPLAAIQLGRIKLSRIFGPQTSAAAGKRIHPEMNEHRQLVFLPGALGW